MAGAASLPDMAEVDRQDREYDVVVFGATGFTGRLTAAQGEVLSSTARSAISQLGG